MNNTLSWTIFLYGASAAFGFVLLSGSVTGVYIDYVSSTVDILEDDRADYHLSGFFDLENEIRQYVGRLPSHISDEGYWVQAGITSHHLPTALSFIADFYKTLEKSDGPRDTFVIIGPDHLEKCAGDAAVTRKGYNTPFGKLETDGNVIQDLIDSGAVLDDDCFEGEHSIGVQTVFIKHLYPRAEIVPVLFSSNASHELVKDLVSALSGEKDRVMVIASVDFSHYENYERAQEIDAMSEEMIRNLDAGGFTLKHADSPASLKFAVLFSINSGNATPIIIGRANSYNFNSPEDNTTGYINAMFANYKKTQGLSTLMFVGDMMLTRSVGKKIEEAGDWRWPFLKIGEYLSGADLTFGNLETTISERGRNVGSIYSFRSNPRVVDGLSFAGFDLLSVANNHMGDWTREAFEDTFNILKKNGIGYVGGGFGEEEVHSAVIREINGTKFGFLGYTDLGARYTEAKGGVSGIAWASKEVVERDVKKAREKADMIVVSIHFGDEYKTQSNARQKILARSAIDAGASLVIGHHPHVVEEVEEYNGGYIAYSLGNFIFDQNFSKETMEGLLLKVLVKDSRILEVEPVKINISEDFQASLAK